MRLLAADGITSGESGAGGVAGALEAAEQHGLGGIESPPKLGLAGLNVLFVSTEGATNPGNYQRIIGGDAPNSGEM
jgi:diaminopropionate ammonia-lyase